MATFRVVQGPNLHGPDGGIIADDVEVLGSWVHFFNYPKQEGTPKFTVLLVACEPGMAIRRTQDPVALDESIHMKDLNRFK